MQACAGYNYALHILTVYVQQCIKFNYKWVWHCLVGQREDEKQFTGLISLSAHAQYSSKHLYSKRCIYAAYFPGFYTELAGSSDPLHLIWPAACGEKMPQCPLKCSSVDFSAACGEKMPQCHTKCSSVAQLIFDDMCVHLGENHRHSDPPTCEGRQHPIRALSLLMEALFLARQTAQLL